MLDWSGRRSRAFDSFLEKVQGRWLVEELAYSNGPLPFWWSRGTLPVVYILVIAGGCPRRGGGVVDCSKAEDVADIGVRAER